MNRVLIAAFAGAFLVCGIVAVASPASPMAHEFPPLGWAYKGLAAILIGTSVGLFRKRQWGRHLALAILWLGLIGPAVAVIGGIFTARISSAIIAAIVIAMIGIVIWWLERPTVKDLFARGV